MTYYLILLALIAFIMFIWTFVDQRTNNKNYFVLLPLIIVLLFESSIYIGVLTEHFSPAIMAQYSDMYVLCAIAIISEFFQKDALLTNPVILLVSVSTFFLIRTESFQKNVLLFTMYIASLCYIASIIKSKKR